jgi:hypothetical protein
MQSMLRRSSGDSAWSLAFPSKLVMNTIPLLQSMGTHISRTRSVALDKWNDEQLAAMRAGGNERAARLTRPPPSNYVQPIQIKQGTGAVCPYMLIRSLPYRGKELE